MHLFNKLFTLGLLGLMASSCADRKASTITVALSSEAPIPDGVQSITVKVSRGGKMYHDERYTVPAKGVVDPAADKARMLTVDDIPGTLAIVDDEQSEGPITVRIEAEIVAAGGVTRTAVRSATMPFVAEKQKLLRMPIQIACSQSGITCAAGESCRAGRCMPDAVAEAELEDFAEEKVRPVAGQCFQRNECNSGANEIRIPVETVVAVLRDDCTVPYVFPASLVPGDAQYEGITSASDEKIKALREKVNMGYIWSGDYNINNAGRDEKNGFWTVVDRDPREGWEYANLLDETSKNPEAELRAVLSKGLCDALKADRTLIEAAQQEAKASGKPYVRPPTRLLGTVELRGCKPKPRDLPECKSDQRGIDAAP